MRVWERFREEGREGGRKGGRKGRKGGRQGKWGEKGNTRRDWNNLRHIGVEQIEPDKTETHHTLILFLLPSPNLRESFSPSFVGLVSVSDQLPCL